MPGHTIRLRGPWDFEPLARFSKEVAAEREQASELPPGGKAKMPCDWGADLGDDFLGRVRYTRRFNCPTNLEPAERVWLVFDGVDHAADVALNGQPLAQFRGSRQPHRVEITPMLAPHNVLAVEVCLPADVFDDTDARGDRAGLAGGLIGEVRLEIDRDDPV